MKNIITVLLLVILLFRCKKTDAPINELQQKTAPGLSVSELHHIGDPNRAPDLYIPLSETDWNGWNTFGIRSGYMMNVYNINGINKLFYPCPIANALPFDYTGKHDFVSCVPCDGVYNGYNWDFPGMLTIEVFKNGLPTYAVNKTEFYVLNTDEKNGFDYNLAPGYGVDTMSISAGAADLYFNEVNIADGKQVIVALINPEKLIIESNYNNNASSLPVNIAGLTVSVDLSALVENKSLPAANFAAKFKSEKGIKSVKLSWNDVYDLPIWVYHNFTIRKNGKLLTDGITEHSYIDTVSNNQKNLYELTVNVRGLESSIIASIRN